jgi:hypothetical protein
MAVITSALDVSLIAYPAPRVARPSSRYRARSTQANRSPRRIAMNGRYLDEVRLAMPQDHPREQRLVSYPAGRHWAAVEGDRLLVAVQRRAQSGFGTRSQIRSR